MLLTSTNICTLQQLNALSSLRRLDHLVIDVDANPVTEFSLWRSYVIFRLAHFNLKLINHVEVSVIDIRLSASRPLTARTVGSVRVHGSLATNSCLFSL